MLYLINGVQQAIKFHKKSVNFKQGKISNLSFKILNILYKEGFINSFVIKNNQLFIYFKFDSMGFNVLRNLNLISKPSCKIYASPIFLWKIKKGNGIYILSTSKGIMTDLEARLLNIGGEVLLIVN